MCGRVARQTGRQQTPTLQSRSQTGRTATSPRQHRQQRGPQSPWQTTARLRRTSACRTLRGTFECDDVIKRAHISRKRTQQAAAPRGCRRVASCPPSTGAEATHRCPRADSRGRKGTELSRTCSLRATAAAAPSSCRNPPDVHPCFGQGGLRMQRRRQKRRAHLSRKREQQAAASRGHGWGASSDERGGAGGGKHSNPFSSSRFSVGRGILNFH